jgi:hypothetical protein
MTHVFIFLTVVSDSDSLDLSLWKGEGVGVRGGGDARRWGRQVMERWHATVTTSRIKLGFEVVGEE